MVEKGSKELSASAILEKKDYTIKRVEVPEWDGHVYVRGMFGVERDRWETEAAYSQDMRAERKSGSIKLAPEINLRGLIAVQSIVDKNGKRIFRGTQSEVERLGHKSALALDRVCDVATELSGLTAATGKKNKE